MARGPWTSREWALIQASRSRLRAGPAGHRPGQQPPILTRSAPDLDHPTLPCLHIPSSVVPVHPACPRSGLGQSSPPPARRSAGVASGRPVSPEVQPAQLSPQRRSTRPVTPPTYHHSSPREPRPRPTPARESMPCGAHAQPAAARCCSLCCYCSYSSLAIPPAAR